MCLPEQEEDPMADFKKIFGRFASAEQVRQYDLL